MIPNFCDFWVVYCQNDGLAHQWSPLSVSLHDMRERV